jgi:enterobacterial common antigen flippase
MTPEKQQESHRGILKATSLIGGSAFIKILIDMVRVKFVAILLGPVGVGLIGVYSSIIQMVTTVSGMGISTSGVRQVAQSLGAGDDDQVAKTVIALRRTVWVTGILGLLAMVFGCVLWSHISFGHRNHAWSIAWLGSVILLTSIMAGQQCVLQGMRRIADLAKITIIGAINGTIISIPCFYFWGQRGIVASLVLSAMAALATSWWFARRVVIKDVVTSWRESKTEVFHLLHFGLPIMLSAIMTVLSTFVIRAMLIRQIGLAGVGIYQSAYGLAGVLVNFVLSAMGTDYYPRLTLVANDDQQIGREFNAQTEIALLLAVPGLAATIVFAPVVIPIFYSGEFNAAIDILRWMVFGVFGRVVSWPLGFVILAKGKGKVFFATEFMGSGFHLLMIWLCVGASGLSGTGVAFTALYGFYTLIVLWATYALTHETWTRHNLCQIILFGGVLAGLSINCIFSSLRWARWGISLMVMMGLGTYCLYRLHRITGITFSFIKDKYFSR